MQIPIRIFEFWAIAFLTLALALVVLNVLWKAIDYDLALQSLGRESFIAALAALVEGGSVAALTLLIPAEYLPAAVRALFIPAIVVGLIYKITHYQDWSRYEVFLLLVLQILLLGFCSGLLTGRLGLAFVFFAVFAAICSLVVAVGKSL